MADLELNSIGNGDGNNYLLRDNSKIPLSGSNQISGSLIPATDNSIDVGSSTKNIKMVYTKGITINGTQFLPSDYAQVSHTHTKSDITDFPTLATVATSGSYNDLSNKPTIPTYSAGTNLSLSDTTFNVSSTPSFTNITISGYTITVD